MNYNFSSFLVMDNAKRFKVGGVYDERVSGYQILNIGTYVPVIVKGGGCVGMAKIESLLLTNNTTSVRFTFYNVPSMKEGQIYYNLYRNSLSGSNDYEDAQDVIIPGLMGKNRSNSGSVVIDDDSDDDDDDDFYRGPRAKYPW